MSAPPEKSSPSRASSVSSTPSSLGGTSSGRAPARSTASTYANGMSAASSAHAPHFAGSTYVVMPTTGFPLATLEHPLPLVARDHLVEQLLLRARVVQVVVDLLVTKQRTRDGAVLELDDCVAQRVRKALRVRLVRIAFERRLQLQLLLDAVEPRREQRCKREIRIGVRAGNARLGPQRRAVPDDAEPARAVVVRPRERRRRPAAGGEALVRVDRRRVEDRHLRRKRDLPREVVLEHIGLVGERGLAVLPERGMNVA